MLEYIRLVLTITDLIAIASLFLANINGLIAGDPATLGIIFAGLILIAMWADVVGAIVSAIGDIISSIFRF